MEKALSPKRAARIAESPSNHLLTVWNPSYESSALEAHLRVLLDWDDKCARGEASVDDRYVWWGKVRSARRLQPLPHHADVIAIGNAAAEASDDAETHLYLTDYRSLFVAGLLDITEQDPRVDDDEHVPAYYADRGLNCDFWFRLFDIRLIVRDDLEAVATELARLRNTRYHNSPVSMYGGMLDLPLIVKRTDDVRFFDEAENEQLANGMLWARFDSTQRGSASLEVSLREDHFGHETWTALPTSARRFIASAEEAYRSRRNDPASDLSDVIVGYAKAVEVLSNIIVRAAMANAPQKARLVKLGDRTTDVNDRSSLTLGQLAHALRGEREFCTHLYNVLSDGAWFIADFAALVDEFSVARNAAAHDQCVSRDVAKMWRNRMLGVGFESVIARLAAVRLR